MGTSLVSNPPYNLRWKHPVMMGMMPGYMGMTAPPEQNANYAFILQALARTENRAALILPNGITSAGTAAEVSIRKQLINLNVIRAVIALPDRMFESTSIPVCVLVLDKHKETRKICMIDLKEHTTQETRDQNGQFGGNSHTGRTYHKAINVLPDELIDKVVKTVNTMADEPGFCKCVEPSQLDDGNILSPSRYVQRDSLKEQNHRPYADIATDYNRVIRQKNVIRIRMNKTAAKRLGYDCMDGDRPDASKSFEVTGQKVEKENYIRFSADDGIDIHISTKDNVHPLILDFLNHWKQMIMYLNNEENRLLAEYRDALLPDLMSGKIEID